MNTKKEMTSPMRKASLIWIVALAGACLMVLIPAVWCWYGPLKVFRPSRAPDTFPQTDIVYNGEGEFGFVNADGSGVTTVPLILGYGDFHGTWQSPLMTGDGKTILVTYSAVPGRGGKVFAIPAGEKPVDCGWYGAIQFTADGSYILVNTGTAIEKYLLEDCGTGNAPEKVYPGVVGALSPDEQYVAEISEKFMEPHIIIRHLETGEERDLRNGDFPVWSRDGEWLAYTGTDGIYIVQNSPNAGPRRLVYLEGPDPSDHVPVYQEDLYVEYYPPIASWSPDGQWLVYHVYSKNLVAPDAGAWAGHYSIFKVNVNTGETTKLLDGGYSPSWRWPVEEP